MPPKAAAAPLRARGAAPPARTPVSQPAKPSAGTKKAPAPAPKKKEEPKPPADPRDPDGKLALEFKRLDRNGDGVVDLEELHWGMLMSGWELDEVPGVFDLIDTDGDGKITWEEFLAFRQKRLKPLSVDLEGKAKQVLDYHDEDKDCKLNFRELARIIKTMNEEEGFLADHELGTYIKRQLSDADKDGDKALSVEEFIPWYDGFIKFVSGFRAEEESRKKAKAMEKQAETKKLQAMFEKEGLWEVDMSNLLKALEGSWDKRRTPLIIDDSMADREAVQHSPLETFLAYGGGSGGAAMEVLEMKKMVVEVNMQKTKKLEDAMEEARKKLVCAVKYGRTLVLALANSVPPIKSKFNGESTLPLDVLDSSKVHSVQDSTSLEDSWLGKVIKKSDDCVYCRKDFNVFVVTRFKAEDYEGFLKDELPLEQMQAIRVYSQETPKR